MLLKCFIAIAFDRGDTDSLYDKLIKPLLKRKKITPFRVDQSSRNDDIDDQILSELGKCDFVIADLTYARPSVYFEAGVAQGRPVPVIYTCRRDHFKHRTDDHHGNFRVHFDLQMKPIIKWDIPPSISFSRQLTKRIGRILRPIIEKKRNEEQAREKATNFAKLSLAEKKHLLEQTWTRVWRQVGFHHHGDKAWPSRKASRRLHVIHAYFVNKLSRRELQACENLLEIILPHQLRGKLSIGESVTVHIFFICLARIPRRMVEEALPSYRITEYRGEVSAKGGGSVELDRKAPFRYRGGFTLHGRPGSLRASVAYHIISGAESEPGFKQIVMNSLERIR
jgi:hypothetical protein